MASFSAHSGEEPQLAGDKGSGTIFFSHYNLKYIFCQNYDISVTGMGQEVDDAKLASIMLYLQKNRMPQYQPCYPQSRGSPYFKGIGYGGGYGLNIPLVYNCSGPMVRHLVMPGNLNGTYNILKFLKE